MCPSRACLRRACCAACAQTVSLPARPTDPADGHGISLLELQPLTGRTHQLRVHCAWLGCLILGDPQYGGAESGGPGQQLCAVSIRFFHPFLKKWLEIRSEQDVSLDFPANQVV